MRKLSPYSKGSSIRLKVNRSRQIQLQSKTLADQFEKGQAEKTTSALPSVASSTSKILRPLSNASAGNLLTLGHQSNAVPKKIWFQFGMPTQISKGIGQKLQQLSVKQKWNQENSLLNNSSSQYRCADSNNENSKDPAKSEGGSTCGDEATDIIEKFAIDNIVFMEQAWHSIMESLRYGQNLGPTCHRCWSLINLEALQQLSGLFSDSSLEQLIHNAQILEIISVAIIQFLIPDSLISDLVNKSLKSMATCCYNNCLNFLQLIYIGLKESETSQVIRTTILALLLNKKGKLLEEEGLKKSFCSNNLEIKQGIAKLLKLKTGSRFPKPAKSILEKLNHVVKEAEKGGFGVNTAHVMISEAIKSLPSPAVKLGIMALQPVKTPFLPILSETQKNYTLVLDLDETLVHYMDLRSGSKLLIRPGAREFLEEMSKHFEIVIYTAGMSEYANWALNILDKDKKWIKHRLFRQHTMPIGPAFIKDLSKLGRDLARTIIVDNMAENFVLQAENGIFIKTWIGDPTDEALPRLCPILRDLVVKGIPDVRLALHDLRST